VSMSDLGVHRTSNPGACLPESTREATQKKVSSNTPSISAVVHETVASAGASILHTVGVAGHTDVSATPSASLHLIDRHGADYGVLVPLSGPKRQQNSYNTYGSRSFAVYDKTMGCFVTYHTRAMSVSLTQLETKWINDGYLSFDMMEPMTLVAQPNSPYGTPTGSSMFLSFTSKDCTGTPLFDMSIPYNFQGGFPSDLMLDYCFGLQAAVNAPYNPNPKPPQLRAFKLSLPKSRIHVSAPRSYCQLQPDVLPRHNGTITDYRVCDKCQRVTSLSAHPFWAELIDVTDKLPNTMPIKPVMLKWI
jgi:hypothetical protein